MAFYSSNAGGLIGAPSERIVKIITVVFVYAFVSLAAGLAILGAPLRSLFHRLGRRSRIDALILGVVLSFACSLVLTTGHFLWPAPGSNYSSWDSGGATVINNSLTAHGWFNAIRGAAWISVAGGVVGLAVWRLAYRQQRKP